MKKVKVIFLILSVAFLVTGCRNKNTNKDLDKKTIAEIKYVDTKIIDILNALNNISFRSYSIKSEEVDLSEKSTGEQGQGSSGGESQSDSSQGNSKQSSSAQGRRANPRRKPPTY